MGISNSKFKTMIMNELYSVFSYRGQAENFARNHTPWECIQHLKDVKGDTVFSGVHEGMSGKQVFDRIMQKEKLKIFERLG